MIGSGRVIIKLQGHPTTVSSLFAFKRCFRLTGVLLKLSMLILGCAKSILFVRIFWGNLSFLEFITTFLSISRKL